MIRIYGGLANFKDPGGWPMSDNEIFQGGFRPPITLLGPIEPLFIPHIYNIYSHVTPF